MPTHKGKFKVKNPNKYQGNVNEIVYRSWWEFRVMKFLDESPNVATWSSEEFFLWYYRRHPGRKAKYYPDFFIEWKSGKKSLWEVKPYRETLPPKPSPNKKKKTLIQEAMTYEINMSKFAAAKQFCDQYNIEFLIITENELPNLKNYSR